MASTTPPNVTKTARQKAESLAGAGFTQDALVWAVLALADAVAQSNDQDVAHAVLAVADELATSTGT